jgi:hypothetical protein
MKKYRSRSLGTIASRTKGKPLSAMEVMNFALEQAVKRIAALEKQNDALAKLNKAFEIRLNGTDLKLSRFAERFMERIGRLERRVSSGDPE